jgi:hypothetical protein
LAAAHPKSRTRRLNFDLRAHHNQKREIQQ